MALAASAIASHWAGSADYSTAHSFLSFADPSPRAHKALRRNSLRADLLDKWGRIGLFSSLEQPKVPPCRLREAYICDAVRTPIARYAGALLCADRRPRGAADQGADGAQCGADWAQWSEFPAAANGPGEDNAMSRAWRRCCRGLPEHVPGTTINRLCASGLTPSAAARAVKTGEIGLPSRRRRVDDGRPS